MFEKPIKLSELTQNIQQVLDRSFSSLQFWVIADVTNHTFKVDSNVHYFDLVEKDLNSSAIVARINTRAWGIGAGKIQKFELECGQRFENNINVLVLVSVNYSSSFGLQLNLHDIDPSYTIGHFERQRNATLARLVALNPDFISRTGSEFLSKNKRLLFTPVIQNIAVITSDTSAGYQDFVHTLETNAFSYKFNIKNYFTFVQGEANAGILVKKLIEIFESSNSYDAVVIIRGGGAQTDFLIFDDYQLARAVAKFPVPIITGIGHHKNQTIVDLMANSVTNTPTKAAEFILHHNRLFEESLFRAQKSIIIQSQLVFSMHNKILSQLKSSLLTQVFRSLNGHQRILTNLTASLSTVPKFMLSNRNKDLVSIGKSILTKSNEVFSRQRTELAHFSVLINLMSPRNILTKGFAIIKLKNNIIGNADMFEVGSEVQIQMATAELSATITSKKIG